MTEWISAPVSDITTLIKRGKAPLYADTGMLVLNQRCIRANKIDLEPARFTDSSKRPLPKYALVAPSDVLVTSTGRGTVGRSALAPDLDEPFTVDSHVSIVRPDSERVSPGYLALVLSARQADLVSLQSGSTTQTELSPTAIGSVVVPVPPIAEQCRIVDVMAAVDGQINSLVEEIEQANHVYANSSCLLWLDDTGTEFAVRPLGELMRLDVERVKLDPDRTYAIAGVLGSGQGMIDKGTFLGKETQYEAMNLLRSDQVVMRKLTAWEGPITVVPAAFDGHVASNEFPTFTLGDGLDPAWMRHVCRTSRLWAEMRNRVTGSVQRRKRLNPDQLLAVSLPIPAREVQARAAAGLDALDEQIAALSDELTKLRTFRSALLTSLLNQEIQIPESYDSLLEKVS